MVSIEEQVEDLNRLQEQIKSVPDVDLDKVAERALKDHWETLERLKQKDRIRIENSYLGRLYEGAKKYFSGG